MKKRLFAAFALIVMFFAALPLQTVLAAEPILPALSNVLRGRTISVMGDSISTYTGWSDAYPITDESCTNRYGEAYYGPEGGDFHNTELLVEDTWWHQAAHQLGAEILMSNAGNSTGLFHASYPSVPAWDLYLKEMLAWKSRPYYLGKDGKQPDIIALYIGSNELGKVNPAEYGKLEDVDFGALITENADGSFTYATPANVIESYCILLHKVSVTYPNAEVYCFAAVSSAGGSLSLGNKRFASCGPFEEMVRSVADHYGAFVVDLPEAFGLDPNGDGVIEEADWTRFNTYYHNDPHPNALGFDIITEAFVKAVLENSKYVAAVQTKADLTEYIGVSATKSIANGIVTTKQLATDFISDGGMLVNYESSSESEGGVELGASESYTSADLAGTYLAEGGSTLSTEAVRQEIKGSIPLTDTDAPNTPEDETLSVSDSGWKQGEILSTWGDVPEGEDDGVYDYYEQGIARGAKLLLQTLSMSVREHVGADDHSGLRYIYNRTQADGSNDLIRSYANSVKLPTGPEDVPPITDGYDYVYIGSDQLSHYYACLAYDHPDAEGFPDETPTYSDDKISLYVHADHSMFTGRKLTVPRYYLPHTVTPDGTYPARYESIQMFTLAHANGTVLSTYCADQTTPAVKGHSYRIANLEDATYYSVDEARMIRTVVNNGYWGAPDGLGSLDYMKGLLRASGKFTEEEINAINDGMAMTATQYAVWTFSNVMDNTVYVNTYYNATGGSNGNRPVFDQKTEALIMKLYHYLISLPPTSIDPVSRTTANTIINEMNFLDDAQITITDKPLTHPYNQDADDSNDVYTVSISFALAVKPDEIEDDLIMTIFDEEGDPIAVGRIAGQQIGNEPILYRGEGGYYTLSDITMQEGEQNVRFILSGSQQLGLTAHLFTSEVKDGEPSQTMVGLAEGDRAVRVIMKLRLNVQADDLLVYTRHVWRTETILPPQEPPRTPPLTGVKKRRGKAA